MNQGDATGNSPGIAIGHLALRRGLISPEQLREALIEQSKSGLPGGTLRPLDIILIDKGFLSRSQIEELHLERETATFPAPPPEPPAVFGKYKLVREAGRGAMARVYEALDLELQRKVALKMLLSNPNAQAEEARLEEERFLREARLSAGLPKHPNIVGIYDAGVIAGRRYLAMEFIDGLPMDRWLKAGSLSIGRPTALLRDVALAVHHAHGHGVIHRDLKPANILVDPNNQPHVMDFGLAKIVGQSVKSSYTEGGFAVGTPAYMSPEQVQGAQTVDHRTDVYSMGVMLYEILTGRLPFTGSTPMEVMQKAAKEEAIPPSRVTSVAINPEYFKRLEAICLKAMAKDPRDRYPSAQAFADDLSSWLKGKKFRISNRKRRRAAAGLAAAAALVALAAFVAVRKPWLPSIDSELARAELLLRASKPAEALVVYSRILERDGANVRAEGGRASSIAKLQEKPAPPPDPWDTAVDVLSAVALESDVVSGKWVKEDGALVSREGKPARLQLPYRPAEEYDVRVTFARQAANYCVNLILTRNGEAFTLVMHRDGIFGFERILGEDFHKNKTSCRFEGPLQFNKSYTVTVEVRKGGVKSFCNGRPMSVLESYDGVSMNPDWKLPAASGIGVGTWDGGAAIQKLEVREVGSAGQLLRIPVKK